MTAARSAAWLLPWALLAAATPGDAAAQDTPQEFTSFLRPRAEHSPRVVVDRLQWAQLTRAPAAFGPAPLRADDALLLDAARAERWGEVMELVKSGRAFAGARDERGDHALERAARAGRDDVVRLLLRHGARTDQIGSDGFTPLGAAAFFGHRPAVRLLLRAGASPEAFGASGNGPLHLASGNDHTGVIDELLAAGLDPWTRNRAGDTALDVAAQHGSQQAMDRLIRAGVDPSQLGR